MLRAHFSTGNLNAEQSHFVTCVEAKSVCGSPTAFYLEGTTFSPSLISEIIGLFGCVGVYEAGNNKIGSFKYQDKPWKASHNCVAMVPGFDNSPTYNIESVELCLL